MNIRVARPDDIPALTGIYNQAIRAGQQTADVTPLTDAERRPWFESHPPESHPILVAEEDGSILGYLTISPYRPGRMALQRTAEVSYYVHQDHLRKGVGTNLMERALALAPTLGIRTLIAILIDTNRASVALLEKHGFARWGHLPDIAEFDGSRVGQFYYGLHLPANPDS